jgi:hypothetical protein
VKIIIPSKNSHNLIPCVSAIFELEPAIKKEDILVIDDGLDLPIKDLKVTIIPGIKPFIFARNINLGIKAAQDDVILLNDDALLRTIQGFTQLETIAKADSEIGLLSPAMNEVGNQNQWRHTQCSLREELKMLCFVCVYIPLATQKLVGLLDERFGHSDLCPHNCTILHYGHEDNDFSRRVREAGKKLIIYDGVFVDHSKLTPTFRAPHTLKLVINNDQIYKRKWGDLN